MNNKKFGYTLIELMIYFAIIGTVLFSFIQYSISVSRARTEAAVAEEVQSNARNALQIIRQKLYQAASVDVAGSSFGIDPGVLALRMDDTSEDPTIIDTTATGTLRIAEGAASPILVTSGETKVEQLVFTNLSPAGERANIQIEITIAYRTPSGAGPEYVFSSFLQTAVTVRK